MRDEGLGSKPLAEAVQAVLLDTLNMKTDLEVLEQRVFRERLWKQDLQFIWIRWFMDYPDPHNEYFDTFYGKKTTGRRQAWVNDAFDKELEAGRDTRDPKKRLEHYKKAEEIMQQDVGLRAGGVGGAVRGQEAVGGRTSRRTRRASTWWTATSTWTCSSTSTSPRRASLSEPGGGRAALGGAAVAHPGFESDARRAGARARSRTGSVAARRGCAPPAIDRPGARG